MTAREPFRIDVAQEALDELRERLTSTRWQGELPGADWSYGVHQDYLAELMQRLRTVR